MNLNDSELEERLRELTPVAPSAALAEAIARDLPPRAQSLAVRVPTAAILARPARAPRKFPALLGGLGWACAGACAAVAVIFATTDRAADETQSTAVARTVEPAAASAPAPGFDFAESSAEVLAAEDEGIVYSDDDAPVRQVRYSSIERHVWTDASTGARMEIEIPREDIRLMPVAMQ